MCISINREPGTGGNVGMAMGAGFRSSRAEPGKRLPALLAAPPSTTEFARTLEWAATNGVTEALAAAVPAAGPVAVLAMERADGLPRLLTTSHCLQSSSCRRLVAAEAPAAERPGLRSAKASKQAASTEPRSGAAADAAGCPEAQNVDGTLDADLGVPSVTTSAAAWRRGDGTPRPTFKAALVRQPAASSSKVCKEPALSKGWNASRYMDVQGTLPAPS